MATPSDVPILGQPETQSTEPELTDAEKAELEAAQAASDGPVAQITPFGIFVTFFIPNQKVGLSGGPEAH